MGSRISIIQGDITSVDVSAIVNAANTSLLGGLGVDGAIHRAAGPELLDECRELKGCPTGEARITSGYNLPARWVIHTVGPIWRGGTNNEDFLLSQCYRNCLDLARAHGIPDIAFPSISTGAYRFPVERACKIAITEIDRFLRDSPEPKEVIIVCFSKDVHSAYADQIGR